MNYLFVIVIVVVLFALRLTKLNILGWVAAWWLASFLFLNYGIDPPMPASIMGLFMGIITLALLAYLSASTAGLELSRQTIVRFLVDKKFTLPLALIVMALPLLVAWKVYSSMTQQPEPPVSGRTIHPPPPSEIQFKGKKIDLVAGVNPFRELEKSDPQSYRQHVETGRTIYFQNCVFCHGDDMKGRGLFAHGFNPIPANFADPTTIAMLQETYLFWRIARGAPGLPEEATPWSSAMPAWENFLTEDEIWDVILFLYDHTGQKPRAREEEK